MIILIKLDTLELVQKNINQNKMTVVYFTGNSCGACEVIKEKIEKFLENYPNIKAYEINGEENTTVQMTPKHIKIIPSASIHLHLPLELFPLISLMTK